MQNFDLIIIGGGAAGMMAAISAASANPSAKIAIVDRTFALGRKILVCGAGRCNLTNINLDSSIDSHYYGANNSFIHSIFAQFGYKQIIQFFEDLGVQVYTERKTDIGKVFPITDQAKTITEMMLDEIERAGIKVFLNTQVVNVVPGKVFKIESMQLDPQGNFVGKQDFTTTKIILSAGGKTYPALGSNGSGYNLAESLGHTMIGPVPSALPLEGKNALSQELQGTKLELEVTSIINGKDIKTRTDDVMFTQYGLSGPAILNISREVSIHINRLGQGGVQVKLNFFPGKTTQQVSELLNQRWQKRPTQLVQKSLYGLLPNKVAEQLVNLCGIRLSTQAQNLTNQQKNELVTILSNYKVNITGTRGWNEAEFTAGGINALEINEFTLESKLVPNLYICGEIIDVDGDVGGFNLSWSWSSGFVAGKNSVT